MRWACGILAAHTICNCAHTAPPITAAAFSPDGKSVVLGSQAGIEIRSWPDLAAGRRVETSLAHIHDLVFSPDGTQLAAAGGAPQEEGAVEVYSWPELTQLYTAAGHEDLVYAVAWQADGAEWATASADGSTQVHSAAGGELKRMFAGHAGAVRDVAWLDDDTLVTAGVDNTLRVWEAASGRLVRTMENHTAPINDLALSPIVPDDPSRRLAATAGEDRTIRLWQPAIGRMVRFGRIPVRPLSLAWSNDGELLLAGCVDGRLRVLDADTLAVVVDEPAIEGWIYAVAPGPGENKALIAGTGGEVRRMEWYPRAGRRVKKPRG